MDEISLLQICETHFTELDIENAKVFLFELLNRKILRKGDGKNKRNLKDIIKIIKENPDLLPTFVAKDLNKLPPITFDHIDSPSLLRDILLIKEDIRGLKASASSEIHFQELKSEYDSLKITVKKLQQDLANSCGGFQSCSESPNCTIIQQKQSTPTIESRILTKNHIADSNRYPTLELEVDGSRRTTTSRRRRRRKTTGTTVPTYTDIARNLYENTDKAPALLSSPKRQNKLDNNNIDDFKVVTNKKSNQFRKKKVLNRQGKSTLTFNNIKVAPRYSYIYVSRFECGTSEKNLTDFIQESGESAVKVELLEQYNQTSYSSFKITILKEKEEIFLSESFWPIGIVYRYFRFKRTHKPPPV